MRRHRRFVVGLDRSFKIRRLFGKIAIGVDPTDVRVVSPVLT